MMYRYSFSCCQFWHGIVLYFWITIPSAAVSYNALSFINYMSENEWSPSIIFCMDRRQLHHHLYFSSGYEAAGGCFGWFVNDGNVLVLHEVTVILGTDFFNYMHLYYGCHKFWSCIQMFLLMTNIQYRVDQKMLLGPSRKFTHIYYDGVWCCLGPVCEWWTSNSMLLISH